MDRILIYRTKYLGDVILTTPIIKAVKQRYPDCELTVATDINNAPVLKHNPHVDRILTVDLKSLKSMGGKLAWISLLKKGSFDLCINLQRSLSSALYIWAAGIPQRVGFSTEGGGMLQTASVSYDYKTEYEINCFAAVARLADVEVRDQKTEVFFDNVAAAKARELIPVDKYCTIHVGKTNPAKMWPPENIAALVDAVWECNCTPVLVGSKMEAEFADKILSYCKKPAHNIVGKTDLLELAAVLHRSRLFIGVDSGPMHLANAVGAKSVVLFGPTSPAKWGHPGNVNLSLAAPCSPCYPRTCKKPWCMDKIPTDTVIEKVRAILCS